MTTSDEIVIEQDSSEKEPLDRQAGESDERENTSGEETTPPKARSWVTDLRNDNRELKRNLKAAQEQLARMSSSNEAISTTKPTLDSCAYDEELYSEKLLAWNEIQRSLKLKQSEEQAAKEKIQREFEALKSNYEDEKKSLNVSDMAEMQELVIDALTNDQQVTILECVDKPGLVVYALGKNLEELSRLAAIKHDKKFAIAISAFEKRIKLKSADKPTDKNEQISTDRQLTSAPSGTGKDAKLEALRKAASESGDYTQVVAYKKLLKVN